MASLQPLEGHHRWRVALRTLLLAAALLIIAPAHAQTATLSGAWRGIGFQVGPAGAQMSWDVILHVHADMTSRIEYPTLACRGVLHELRRSAAEIEFREEITEGDCFDGGLITARLESGRVFWFWRKPGIATDATAVLYRDQPVA